MAREIDEAWIDEAIERYQRIEARLAEFEQAVKGVEVTVRSPDGLVEVVVSADGCIRDVRIGERFHAGPRLFGSGPQYDRGAGCSLERLSRARRRRAHKI